MQGSLRDPGRGCSGLHARVAQGSGQGVAQGSVQGFAQGSVRHGSLVRSQASTAGNNYRVALKDGGKVFTKTGMQDSSQQLCRMWKGPEVVGSTHNVTEGSSSGIFSGQDG